MIFDYLIGIGGWLIPELEFLSTNPILYINPEAILIIQVFSSLKLLVGELSLFLLSISMT